MSGSAPRELLNAIQSASLNPMGMDDRAKAELFKALAIHELADAIRSLPKELGHELACGAKNVLESSTLKVETTQG